MIFWFLRWQLWLRNQERRRREAKAEPEAEAGAEAEEEGEGQAEGRRRGKGKSKRKIPKQNTPVVLKIQMVPPVPLTALAILMSNTDSTYPSGGVRSSQG